VLLVRTQRKKLNTLLKEIRSKSEYSADDLNILEWTILNKPPAALMSIAFPLLAPIMTLSWSWDVLRGRMDPTIESLEKDLARETRVVSELVQEGSSNSKIWNDPAFTLARSLSADIEIKRMPITMLLSAAMLFLTLPCVFFAYGIRVSVASFFSRFFKRTLFANKLLLAGLDVHHLAAARVGSRRR
jgi:hypothetical protein